MRLNPFKGIRDRKKHEAPPQSKVKTVEVAWRPDTQVPTETHREKFLRERRHRRRAVNRTRNAVAKQARKVNRGAYSGR